jgi:crotonobetainyl-CoA:carnitine CoA-transferase CaiB-like acyl-CoA transferase
MAEELKKEGSVSFEGEDLDQESELEKKVIGLAVNREYAMWAWRETNPADIFKKPEALDDMLVIDASYGSFAGLFASSILAEMGAEVIRIEPPGGDIARKMSPFGMMIKDTGLPYLVEGGRNKYHVTCNLETEEGRQLFRRLVRKADVLIETFKPGYLDSLGIGYKALSAENPGLIYCAIHSYGHFGDDTVQYGNQPDYDIIAQARGMIMSIMGEPELDPEVPPQYKRPLKHGNWMGWYVGGAWASYGIGMAMLYKRKTGKGQFIDCSPPEGLLAIANYLIPYFHMSGGKEMIRAGNYDYAVFPYTYVKCKDGYTFISGFTDPNWTALCEIMDRPDLRQQFPTIKERLTPENQPKIQHEIEKFTAKYTADELLEIVTQYSRRPDKKGTVVVGRLEDPLDVLQRDHWKERQAFVLIEDPYYGKLLVQNSSFNGMTLTPGRIKWLCRPVGADNEYIYKKYLGIGKSTLNEYREKNIV